MAVIIKEVKTRRELLKFIRFPEKLYRNNPYYVPPLTFDQVDTLDQKKGAAQEFCDSKLYLAYKDGKLVGRVAAIVNNLANKQWNHNEVRFGWYDFIDDKEVSKALMDKVVEFGKEHKMDSIVGPLGFTDFDPEGLLIEGFDRLNTMPLIYNDPYYIEHIEGMGFEKDADWIEYKVYIPEEKLPEKMERVSKIIMQRSNLHLVPLSRKFFRQTNFGKRLMQCINDCYKDLYNFTVLPEHMADKYLGFYLSVLDLKYVCCIENEKNELIAFGITMPSLAKALQKSRGELFPFGWYHILKSLFLKREEGVELLLIGVLPQYQNLGINSLLFAEMFKQYKEAGVKWAETNAILEDNTKNQMQFKDFEHECKKRRRSYIRKIDY